jgi:hypothetical protein
LITDVYKAIEAGIEAEPRDTWDEEPGPGARRLRVRVLDLFKHFGPRWGQSLSLWFRTVPNRFRRYVTQILQWGFLRIKREYKLREALKKLSILAKKYRDKVFPGFWRWLVDLSQLSVRAVIDADDDETMEDVKNLVTGESPMSKADINFDKQVVEQVKTLLKDNIVRTERTEPLSLKAFCRDPSYWVRAGSSTVSPPEGIKKSKWASSLVLKPKDVEDLMTREYSADARAFLKVEADKNRAVVNAGLESYLQMTYISHNLDQLLKRMPGSFIWMTKESILEYWRQMWLDCSKTRGYNMPIDQTAFDHNPSGQLVIGVCDAMVSAVIRMMPEVEEDVMRVWASLRTAMLRASVSYRDRVFKYEKGILSGWRWTSILDTLINLGEFWLMKKRAEAKLGSPIHILRGPMALGDDLDVCVQTESDSVAIMLEYKSAEIPINEKKFFIARNTSEFLRRIVDNNVLTGYPARGIGGVLYAKPTSVDIEDASERIRQVVTSWLTIHNRTGFDELPLLGEELSRILKLTKRDVQRLLETPSTFGGLGYLPWTGTFDMGLGIVSLMYKPFQLPEFGLVGWSELISDYGELFLTPLVKKLKTILQPKKQAKRKILEQLEIVDVAAAWPKSMYKATFEVPTSARVAGGLFSTGLIYEELMRLKRYDEAVNLLDDESKVMAQRMKMKASRRVWLDFMVGKLPFHKPVVRGVNDTLVASVYAKQAGQYMGAIVQRKHISYSDVLNAAYCAERATRSVLVKEQTWWSD